MMKRIIWGITLSVLAAGSANAALLGRVPATPGGTDYQAYYDTELNITWLADANLAASNDFGVPRAAGYYDGYVHEFLPGDMTWDTAQQWIKAMNDANYLGVNTWRLPKVGNPNVRFCRDWTSYNPMGCVKMDPSTDEMAHMYYSTLGNIGGYDVTGAGVTCSYNSPLPCLRNTGPFTNLADADIAAYYDHYWSDTTSAPNRPYYENYAWLFSFGMGVYDEYYYKGGSGHAWAVSPGDTTVPVPAAGWLMGSALGALGALRRRAGRQVA